MKPGQNILRNFCKKIHASGLLTNNKINDKLESLIAIPSLNLNVNFLYNCEQTTATRRSCYYARSIEKTGQFVPM